MESDFSLLSVCFDAGIGVSVYGPTTQAERTPDSGILWFPGVLLDWNYALLSLDVCGWMYLSLRLQNRGSASPIGKR